MYTEHFGLNEKPFSISPDPRYLYLSQRHADALAHLLYGVTESGGFIQLTGEVGTGKTTLIRSLLEQLPDNTEVALILNPQVSKRHYLTHIIQFLQSICQELRIPVPPRGSARALIDVLNERLLELHAENKRVVLIIDEAQTMSPELLEQVRLLTNLETSRQKLLQIILIGQPELRDLLADTSMRQIAQRITGRYHLEPLSAADAAAYIGHRLKVAGGRSDMFTPRAIRKLYRLSRGIPRLINVVADRALLAAYTQDEHRVSASIVRHAAREVFGQRHGRRWMPWAAALVGLALIGWLVFDRTTGNGGELQLALADLPADARLTLPERAQEPPGALDGLIGSDDGADAAGTLFGLWNAAYAGDTASACGQVRIQSLSCLVLAGEPLATLRRLDRPVRLELFDDAGKAHYVVLTALDATEATLKSGSAMKRVPIAELDRFRAGEQLLLWRPAIADFDGTIAAGARGPGVVWIRTALEELSGTTLPGEDPTLFDAGLGDALSAYQQRTGLPRTGEGDALTIASLQSDIGLVGVSLSDGMR